MHKRWKLSQLAAFSHAQDHLKVQTVGGGIVTLLGACVALLLFFSEAWQCLSVRRVQEMSVDVARGEDLHVTFNLTFPALPCEALLLDAGDVSGKWQTESKLAVARNGEVHKHSVDMGGNWLKLAEYTPPMGGEWDNPFVLRVDQQELTDISDAIKRHEGCNIYGWLQVARVAGNIHFAVRPEALFLSKNAEEIKEALRQRQVLLHGMGAELHPDASKLNMSHVVHTLRFGPPFPGQANPLEGCSEIDRKSTGIDKHFIKVVPTDYYSLWGRKTHTYQYSVTSYYQQFKGGEETPPAVYLLYDASPIRVELRDTRPGVLRLLVRVCAVVGGAFAVTGLLDKIIEGLLRDVRKALRHSQAYKLGLRRWSYNSVEVKLREAGGGAAGRSAAVVHAAANGVRFAAAHQDSAVGFLLHLDNGAKVQAHVFLCYADATPASRGAAGGGGGGEEGDEQFAWSLVTRAQCCKGCQGAALRSIQRFGRVGPRQAKRASPEQPADTGAAADSTVPAATSGRKQPARKDPRFMYLSLDEACTHVGARAFRLVAGIYNRQGTRLLGTAVSPPIRVLANNDAPTGAARIVLEATLPSDWEGWGGGNGGGLGAKRSGAAAHAQRKAKRPSGEHTVPLQAALSMPSPAVALPLPHMPGHPSSSPGVAAAQQWQQVQGPLSPEPRPIVRQPSLPSHPPSPLVLGGGSMGPVPPADAAQNGELWAAVPPAALAVQLAPSLPFCNCSQVAAQHEAERQLTLLQQLKASMAVAGGASASSSGSPHGAMAGWCSGDGSAGQAEAEQPPCWLPGIPLTAPVSPPMLPTCASLLSADTTLSAACAAALTRVGSVAGSGSPGSSLPLPPPPSPPALEPGLGLGGRCSLECSSLEDDLGLEQLHSLMGDLDDCGLSLDMGCSIFDDSEVLQFAL